MTDRYRTAWRSARQRAAVLSAELTRRAPLLGEYAAENTQLHCWHDEDRAALAEMRGTIERLRAEKQDLGELAARREAELIHYRAQQPADRCAPGTYYCDDCDHAFTAPTDTESCICSCGTRAWREKPADADLRDRIRRAICEASGSTWLPDELMEPDEYGEHADAVLAVLPPSAYRRLLARLEADRAGHLRAAEEATEEVLRIDGAVSASAFRHAAAMAVHAFEGTDAAQAYMQRTEGGEQVVAADADLRERIARVVRTVPIRLGPNALAMAQRGESIILNMGEADAFAGALEPVLPEARRQFDAGPRTVARSANESTASHDLATACGQNLRLAPADRVAIFREGWLKAARFLRRTPRDSADFHGALRGARLIEDEVRRMVDEAQRAGERPRCPHCQLPHDLEPGSLPVTVCESARRQIADEAQPATCTNCHGSGLDPRYNGEFACPDCTPADQAQQAECACDPTPHRQLDGTYSHLAGCPVTDAEQFLDERVAAAKEQPSLERSDVGTEFVQQIDNLDEQALAKVEAELVESGVETPGCDCGHDGMGVRWHDTACMWRSTPCCTCADAGPEFAPAGHYADCPQAVEAQQADTAGEGR